jgi:hypothetical protein
VVVIKELAVVSENRKYVLRLLALRAVTLL